MNLMLLNGSWNLAFGACDFGKKWIKWGIIALVLWIVKWGTMINIAVTQFTATLLILKVVCSMKRKFTIWKLSIVHNDHMWSPVQCHLFYYYIWIPIQFLLNPSSPHFHSNTSQIFVFFLLLQPPWIQIMKYKPIFYQSICGTTK